MRLRFVFATRSCVKILMPVMAAAVKEGHEVRAAVTTRPHREPVLPEDHVWAHYPDVSKRDRPDATVASRLENHSFAVASGKMVVVPYFWEFLMRPLPDYAATMLCYPSKEAAERHGARGCRKVVTGWTLADHAQAFSMKVSVSNRNCHAFFSMKRDVPGKAGYLWYLRTALLDRAVAHRRGLRWVVKTRPKHKDPWWLRALADEYLGDTSMWPHTSHYLLNDSASMSHFTSGAVAEAVLHGVPTLWYRSADHRHHLAKNERQPDEYLQPWLMDRATYVRRFLGWDDGENGARVVRAIEKAVA